MISLNVLDFNETTQERPMGDPLPKLKMVPVGSISTSMLQGPKKVSNMKYIKFTPFQGSQVWIYIELNEITTHDSSFNILLN